MATAIATEDSARHKPRRRSAGYAELRDDDLRHLLARELHDRVAQTLTTMLIELENYKAEQYGRKGVIRQMEALQVSTREVLSNLREVLYDLRSEESEIGESFEGSIRTLVERFAERSSIHVKLIVSEGWPARVKSPAAINLYRIIEEGLNNIRQHSGATEANLVLTDTMDHLVAVITDNGRGIDLEEAVPPGMGMLGMRERALFLGADLKVTSFPGAGTELTVAVPRRTLG